ncbi:hypothetical protein Pfo_012868 [Paulownia fortunei]|nr:hypothetical protein Pfo_012868 [Paulownia fortunei]
MASSNRHWPSMFKSKPCNTTHHQWQHDVNSSLMSTGCHRTPYTPGPGCEERTPEPKPRWNPRPEQIRILEAIFNSGMVNPPREEIRKIRAQLQEYGQVGDANVFYWFQNRKSRSKHKQRQLQNAKSQPLHTTTPPPITTNIASTFVTAPSSSSSSDKSSPNNSSEKSLSVGPTTVIDLLNSPTASVNQPFFQASSEFLAEPFFYPVQENTGGSPSASLTQGFCFPDVSSVADQSVGNCPNFLLSELMLMSHCPSKKDEDEKMKLQQHLSYTATTVPNPAQPIVPTSFSVPSNNQILQGVGESGPTKSTVFINDVCFEVGVGPFSVREAFGDDAVLIQSSGQPVLTNEWGVTLQPLQHGAFYYLLRPFTPSPDDRTIDLI